MNFQDFPRPNQVEQRLRMIDTELQGEKFINTLEIALEKLLNGEEICFSDIVTQFSGLAQLTYEQGHYYFGEDDGSTTELNDMQKIRLEYAKERMNELLYKIIQEQTSEGFFCLNIMPGDDEYETWENIILASRQGQKLEKRVQGEVEKLVP